MTTKSLKIKVTAFVRGEFKSAEIIVPESTDRNNIANLMMILYSLVEGQAKVTAVETSITD